MFVIALILVALSACSLLTETTTKPSATVTVSFDSNGGSKVEAQTVTAGEKAACPEDPEKEGYTLNAWLYEGKEWSFASKVTRDMTLKAEWFATTYQITYDLGGGKTQNTGTYTIESDDITLSAATKDGYEFLGWTWKGQPIPQEEVTLPSGSTGDKAYIANWGDPIEYTISYDLDGGTFASGNPNPTTYTIESDTISISGSPQKDYYRFVGWSLSKISKGSSGDKTITAKWISQNSAFHKDTIKKYQIVYASQPIGLESVATALQEAIKTSTGYTLPIYRDTGSTETTLEILIGNTNRSLSQSCYEKSSHIMQYEMVVGEHKLQMAVGGPFSGKKCVEAFTSQILSKTGNIADGTYCKTNLATTTKSLTSGADVRIMSSNILAYQWGEQDYDNVYPVATRCEIYIGILLNYLPDVAGVQEADQPWMDALPYYLETVAKKEGVAYTLLHDSVVHNGKTVVNFTPILYRSDKYTVDETGCKIFAANYQNSFCQRVGTYAKFTKKADSSKQFIVVNTHWAHETEERIMSCVNEEATLVNTLKAQYPSLPIFCTGDYNSNPARKPTNESDMADRKTRDQYFLEFVDKVSGKIASDLAKEKGALLVSGGCHGSASTMSEDNLRAVNSIFIDHIVCTGGNYNVLVHDTIVNKNYSHVMTDHSPIYADFSLK